MNVSPLLRTMCHTISSIAPRVMSVAPLTSIFNRTMHHMCSRVSVSSIYTNQIGSLNLLKPSLPMYNLICGMKMKTVLRRRCKSCILLWKKDRKYIKCKEHKRHNQVERKKRPYNTWILTFASQKPVRDW